MRYPILTRYRLTFALVGIWMISVSLYLFCLITTKTKNPNVQGEIFRNRNLISGTAEYKPYTSIRQWKMDFHRKARNLNSSAFVDKFGPMINSEQYLLMLEIWDKFTEICDLNNISYVLYGGTLLGSYRHHAFVPWDDDIDVIVNKTDIPKIQSIVSRTEGFQTKLLKHALKFFKSQYDYHLYHYGWTWPFVDIFFFDENATHIWDAGWFPISICWKKEKYFPTKYRPLEDTFHRVPSDVIYALKREGIHSDVCKTNWWSHLNERRKNETKLECIEIASFIPFVQHFNKNSSEIETLKLNNTILKKYEFGATLN